MSFDFIAGTCALVAMLATIAGRLLTARLVALAHRRIKEISDRRLGLLNEHRVAAARRKTAEANVASLERKKLKLEGRRSRLRKTVDALAAESESRHRQREAHKDALMRT